jgi:hypothetical protein
MERKGSIIMSKSWFTVAMGGFLIMPVLGRAAGQDVVPPPSGTEPAQAITACPGKPCGLLGGHHPVKDVKEKVACLIQNPGPVRQWVQSGPVHEWARESDHPLWQWATYRSSDRPGICGCWPQWNPSIPPPLYTYFLTPDCAGCSSVTPADTSVRAVKCTGPGLQYRVKNLFCTVYNLSDLRNLRCKKEDALIGGAGETNPAHVPEPVKNSGLPALSEVLGKTLN